MHYLGCDRPDVQFATKEASRWMAMRTDVRMYVCANVLEPMTASTNRRSAEWTHDILNKYMMTHETPNMNADMNTTWTMNNEMYETTNMNDDTHEQRYSCTMVVI